VDHWDFVEVFVMVTLDEFPNLNSHLLIKFCGLKHLFGRALVGVILDFNLIHILKIHQIV
jgi:hypothetical protein